MSLQEGPLNDIGLSGSLEVEVRLQYFFYADLYAHLILFRILDSKVLNLAHGPTPFTQQVVSLPSFPMMGLASNPPNSQVAVPLYSL